MGLLNLLGLATKPSRPVSEKARVRPAVPRRCLLEQLEVRELLAPLTWFEGPSLPVGRADAEAMRASDSSILLFGGQAAGPGVSVPRLVPGTS